MIIWSYRIALFILLFGMSALIYGGNALNQLFDKAVSGVTLIGIVSLFIFYFRQPPIYKVAAWLVALGVIGLVLESRHEYGQFVYSYFVIKRFAYCGLALLGYVVASRAGILKIKYAVYLIFAFYVINQLFLGQIFSYNLTSESRSVTSNEALYLVIPFLYYLVSYLKERRIMDFLLMLFTFVFIVFLLHRSVISAAVVTIGVVAGLSLMGKLSTGGFPLGKTVATLTVLLILLAPLLAMLPGNKMNALWENISGILDPKEDNTGSWRLEQSEYYLSLIPDKPVLGWRYVGYDRGEIMENEDFPEKGTIIHSQYIDMLYNYGAVGLAINLLILLGTLWVMYRRNATFSLEQTVLFGFIVSGLVYAVSYQLPVFFWGFVGVGMYYAYKKPDVNQLETEEVLELDNYESTPELPIYKSTHRYD
ncbi:O-antigen ligase family protein [Spirosoma sp. BT702]|uniref:O-antigen ligase family protein n=1 Tax=Spirosoma profusum TaxID=2771354 RepID=A0A927ASK8_9BACT|nr:O-antigen ligase family protein [Spirosoma profusum]MBD2701430.1 O-antigen ligase family protein [Spirosoma profusum]